MWCPLAHACIIWVTDLWVLGGGGANLLSWVLKFNIIIFTHVCCIFTHPGPYPKLNGPIPFLPLSNRVCPWSLDWYSNKTHFCLVLTTHRTDKNKTFFFISQEKLLEEMQAKEGGKPTSNFPYSLMHPTVVVRQQLWLQNVMAVENLVIMSMLSRLAIRVYQCYFLWTKLSYRD